MTQMVNSRTTRERLDVALVARGLAPSRERAQALIAAGLVEVDEQRATGAAQHVGESSALRVRGRPHPWASRGGVKLAAALDDFDIECEGRIALDAGASTGGFTDVLLSRGARHVYAVDVGRGLLDPRLAADPRVTVMDGTNLRTLGKLPGPAPDLVTLDLSFISVRLVLPSVVHLSTRPADVIVLFKPQFELGRDAVGKGGIVRDAEATAHGIARLSAWALDALGLHTAHAPIPAPLKGTKGNQEWLLHLTLPVEAAP